MDEEYYYAYVFLVKHDCRLVKHNERWTYLDSFGAPNWMSESECAFYERWRIDDDEDR